MGAKIPNPCPGGPKPPASPAPPPAKRDCQDRPLCIVSPVEGSFGEHERRQLQEHLDKRPAGRAFVVDRPVTVTLIPLSPLWLVGQNRDETGERWEFQGLYDCESKAVAACRNDTFWLAPVTLNQPIAEETTDWPGQYFPFAGQTAAKANPS